MGSGSARNADGRLGLPVTEQNVRNLFECLGLADEGATLALSCGERPDSPLR